MGVEYAHVHSNVYGTSFESVETVLKDARCILDIDVQGVESVKKSYLNPNALYIFVTPPSIGDLERRLRQRGSETEEKIMTRLTNASHELKYQSKENFWDHIVINDD